MPDGPGGLEAEGISAEDVAEVEAAMARRPKPTEPKNYNVLEAAFWEHIYVPEGSVLTYWLSPWGLVALLVNDPVIDRTGGTFRAKFVAVELPSTREELSAFLEGGKRKFHICCLKEMMCPAGDEALTHLEEFTWYPPGKFTAEWCLAAGKKAVTAGAKAFQKLEEKKVDKGEEEPPAATDVERRLSALRQGKPAPRISFAGDVKPARQRIHRWVGQALQPLLPAHSWHSWERRD